jgi:ATP-dependent Clp protease ATP-binding subunit ClpA
MISPELEVTLNLAVSEAARRGHEYVTVEHVLYSLMFNESAKKVIQACGGDITNTRDDLEGFFKETYPATEEASGHMPQPTIAFQRIIQRAASNVRASGQEIIKGENLLVSLFSEKESYAAYFLEQQEISRFDVLNFISHGVTKPGIDIDELEDGEQSLEVRTDENLPQHVEDENEEDEGEERSKLNKKSALKLYAVDLLSRAAEGKIDPLIGRHEEVDRTVQILCRRRKNNPLYVGEAGVGKTAIAEGLALRIFEGDVPDPIKNAEIFSLDMGAMVAGTKFRGDFEARMKSLLKEIKKRDHAILFIDEIHTVIGAGSVNGSAMDAGNLLKPALSSGELRCIGSTTYKEFREHFKNDHGLARRFQKIDVDEPTVDETIEILMGLKSRYEDHHNVAYSEEAIKTAVELASRHIRDRKLPDTAIDVIDETGASFALKNVRDKDKPNEVSVENVQAVVAKMARIPSEKVSSNDKKGLGTLGADIRAKVFGQDEAIDALADSIKMARSGLGDEEKPIGSFLFAGPTGVGKTEVAKQLSEVMGVEFIRYDMSEYMERHAVSRLIGAPPGYVGFDQGGLLTEAVSKTPHAVLLLDEIEKAHPDIQNILLQVFDHGTLTDSNGRETDFRNTIIIMTTNAGARELTHGSIGFAREVGVDAGKSQAVKDMFSPEFRNRLDGIISFAPLGEEVIINIVEKFVFEVSAKLAAKDVALSMTKNALKYFAKKGYDPVYGARPLKRLIQDELKKPLADELLFGKLADGGKVKVDAKGDELTFAY